MLESLSDQEATKSLLEKLFLQKKVPHALLLTALDSRKSLQVSKELACHLLETDEERLRVHPDFFHLLPEGKSNLHPIDSIRSLIDQVHKASFLGKAKVFLIEEVEKMLPTSSNAFLKTLEEPSSQSYFILTTCYPDRILPTIVSRTHRISLIGKEEEDLEFLEIQELLFSCLSQKMSYFDLSLKIKEIESRIEKKEDPYLKEKAKEKVFLTLYLWIFDQKAKKYRVEPFFKNSSCLLFKDDALNFLQKETILLKEAMQRNIAFSTCLEKWLVQFYRSF